MDRNEWIGLLCIVGFFALIFIADFLHRIFLKGAASKRLSVISCSHRDWCTSSHKMGKDLAACYGKGMGYLVYPTAKGDEFTSVWHKACHAVIVHTHGSEQALYDVRDGGTPQIIDTQGIASMPRNEKIKFVVVTACQAAGGSKQDNVAYHLSRKIHVKGILIANVYGTVGDDTTFCGRENKRGWVIYQNGQIICHAQSLPAELTMPSAYALYQSTK